MLQATVQSSQVGSKVTIINDPGFHFEIHIVSNSSVSCDLYSIVLKFKVEYFAHKQPNHMKHGLDCISIKVLKSSFGFRLEGILCS